MSTISKETKEVKTVIKSRASRDELKRLMRNPMELSDRFGVKDDENFVYRVVLANSVHEPNKVERYKKFGYEIVDTANTLGQSNSGDPSRMGSSTVEKKVRSEEFVMMRIPREMYNENQLIKREVFADQLTMDGNSQKQKVTQTKDGVSIDGGVITADTPLHKKE